MPGIWRRDSEGWSLLQPSGFPDEATLHQRIIDAPQLLPLSGSPRLVVVGSEVRLGSGYADVLAVEPSGRPVVIEVKLSKNAEARRAVVAQALAYAAYLHGLSVEGLETDILGSHLRASGHATLADAVREADQEGAFDPESFRLGLSEHLQEGSFRVVFVLDEAPPELVRLAGYLEAVSDRLVVDVVAVSSYEVGGSQILLPQRMDPERVPTEQPASRRSAAAGELTDGSERFRQSIGDAPSEEQPVLLRLADWADALEEEGLARTFTYEGKASLTLLPRLEGEGAGMATLWNEGGKASITLWRSVMERRAPETLPRIEQAIAPLELGQGRNAGPATDELLEVLTAAYREASSDGSQINEN